jgi:hypothetical protein
MNLDLKENGHQHGCGCPGNPNASIVQAVVAPLPVTAYVPSSAVPTQAWTSILRPTEMPEPQPEVSAEPEVTPESSMEPEITPESSMEPEATPESTMEPEITPESSQQPEAQELSQIPSRQPVTAPVSILRGQLPASLEINLPHHWNGSFTISSSSP